VNELCVPKALSRNENDVMLGIFQPNFYPQYPTAAQGVTEATYEANRKVIKVADEIGLSFSLTLGRWKSIPGESVGYATYGFDNYTLVTAMLATTKRITILSTTHTALWNPVIAAKMGADIDQISGGRWGLNIVAGWNEEEFHSRGVTLLDHEERYVQAAEWLTAVRELWNDGESSFQGKHIKLDHAECHPRPMQAGGPVVVNAGISPSGVKFATDHADYLFTFNAAGRKSDAAEGLSSSTGYIGPRLVIIRETDSAAEERANEIVAHADLLAMIRGPYVRSTDPDFGIKSEEEMRAKYAADPALVRAGLLSAAVIGSPETVGKKLAQWVLDASIDGVCMTMFNHAEELQLLADRGFEPFGNILADAGKRLCLTTDA
jgi:alkanesulfonate monooxygenase SsuD/methylene tetrahydromethanopterin reductase-like flavin-dependent oxidoreductase (luciferase family)